jgi:hypothetical protein
VDEVVAGTVVESNGEAALHIGVVGAGRRLERADCYPLARRARSALAERARSPYDNARGAGRNRTDE